MRDSTKPLSTRDAILEATSRALATVGYKKMKIEDLAREAGIGKGSVYLHFSSKEEIALAHIDGIISDLREEMHYIETLDASAADRIEKMLNARVLMRFDAVQHYTQGLSEMLVSIRDRLLERRMRQFELEAEIIARVISDGHSRKEFDCKDPISVARSMVDATNSLLPYSLSAIEIVNRKDVERRISVLSKLLIAGLRHLCQ